MSIKLLLVDDSDVMRSAIRQLLNKELSYWLSCTSLLRPGRFLVWRAFTR